MDHLVDVQHAGKRYPLDHNFVRALDDVSLRIRRGEFLAVAGPSGSGKSTLLNLIGCLDTPSAGRILIEGVDVATLRPVEAAALRREKIGLVFQTFNLIPVFTALENVEYPLLLVRMPERERRRRVMEALESVGLSHRAGHRPDLLSGGERQRVAVARAIVRRPALVLADEPTANLDTATARQLIELMRDLNARKLLAEARLSSLESRIHPHFLFNTLNSIAALIPKDPKRAEDMVGKLASLLRFSLNANQARLVPLDREIALVRDYLEIERARFGPRLRYSIDVPPEFDKAEVPPLAVATLVENSIKHVVAERPEGGEIAVAASAAPGRLCVQVSDSGPGFALADAPPGRGLDNLASRLALLFGDRARLETVRNGAHAAVRLCLPV